ncbi:hypothetical protein K7432_000874 [Basidiobolus ranarum]|uniref:Integrator complex subunit 4 n=1 Tax=Basidiobolus ranarum TaxID=34480 RepID=A0ABR2X3U8_9FUNG
MTKLSETNRAGLDENVDCYTLVKTLLQEATSKSTTVRYTTYSKLIWLLKVKNLRTVKPALDQLKSYTSTLILELSDRQYLIRKACLELIAWISVISWSEQALEKIVDPRVLTSRELQMIIGNYALDADPRVRQTSLHTLYQLHLRGYRLDLIIYRLSLSALKDDFEEVRTEALQLIWVLSTTYPEHMVRVPHETVNEQIRLVDDAFVKICDMVNDISIKVRTKACSIMGGYRYVDFKFLSQTFSKKVMSHLKRPTHRTVGGAPAPKGKQKGKSIPTPEGDLDVESDEFRLLDSGACGAFIHGLEDEYQEVRNAAVDSICELCMYSEEFSARAVDFLVDMFNDDIDHVRLNSINSLRKIGSKFLIKLDAEQLQIVLGVLEDANRVVRESVHGMLKVVIMESGGCITMFLEALMNNMNRYPKDQVSIYKCFRVVGQRHHEMIESQVSDLLKLDRVFMTREANPDDPQYVGHLILVMNAALKNTRILPVLPKFVYKHYPYLQSKFPGCFPDVEPSGTVVQAEKNTYGCRKLDDMNSDAHVTDFTNRVFARVQEIYETIFVSKHLDVDIVIENCTRDLGYINQLKPLFVGKANFCILLLECYTIIVHAKKTHMQLGFMNMAPQLASNLLELSYRLEKTFLGLTGTTKLDVIHIRLLANILWLIGSLNGSSSQFSLQENVQLFVKRITYLQKISRQEGICLTSLDHLKSELIKIENSPNPNYLFLLLPHIMEFTLLMPDLKSTIKQTTGEILSPTSNPEKPVEYLSIIPLRIRIEAELFNVVDVGTIGIQVTYPDRSIEYFWPSSSKFIPVRPYCYKLNTKLDIKQNAWTANCYIEFHLIKLIEPDIPKYDNLILNQCRRHQIQHTINSKCLVIQITNEPLKYHISPKLGFTHIRSH